MYIAIDRGVMMYYRENPYITSLEEGYQRDERININHFSKPVLRITELRDDDPFSSVELNRDSRKYINVKLNYI